MRFRRPYANVLQMAALWLFAFAVLSTAILHRPERTMLDFDQVYYVTVAYDLDKWGIFTNGSISRVDSTVTRPAPGMFFGPVFPAMVFLAMKIDDRFAAAVRCSVEADRGHRNGSECEVYTVPVRIANAMLLAFGVVAVGAAARRLAGAGFWPFALAGLLAIAALVAEADIFSYVMIESAIFAIYSLLAWILLCAWTTNRTAYFLLAGMILAGLSLTKPSYLALLPAVAAIGLFFRCTQRDDFLPVGRNVLVFAAGFSCVVGPWAVRNLVSVGKFGLTEEYGSAAIVERFAYDDMTPKEFALAFPYCTPGLGNLAFDLTYGNDAMHRFVFHTPGSFFHVGRERRDQLVQQYGRLDPLIGGIVWDEMRTNWWRYLLVNIPLAWCGMWPGGIVTLILLPLFVWSIVRAYRRREPLLILYSIPALLMLGVAAAVGNHYTRYNVILIGPYAVGAALSGIFRGGVRYGFGLPKLR